MTDIEDNPIEKTLPGRFEAFQDVPDGYFENLPDKLMLHIYAMEGTNRRVRRTIMLSGLAVALLVFVGIGAILLMDRKVSDEVLLTEIIAGDSIEKPLAAPEANAAEIAVKYDTGNTTHHSVAPAVEQENNTVDLMALLDNIPIEVIIDYLDEVEELEF